MKKTLLTIYIIVVTVFLVRILWVIFISSNPFESDANYPMSLASFDNSGSYAIDPNTILADIDSHKSSIFTSVPLDSQTPVLDSSLYWRQDDYFKVANALHSFVWKESMDQWNIERISFELDCKNINGLANASFFIYETTLKGGRLQYNAQEMDISPTNGEVSWGGDTRFPRPILGWNSIDLEKMQVPFAEVIQIAEKRGGEAVRSQVSNNCFIVVLLTRKWRVSYWSNQHSVFDIYIDPYNGKVSPN